MQKLSSAFWRWLIAHHTIGLIVILGGFMLAILGVRYAFTAVYTAYAKHTFLKPFYAHVAEAQAASSKIQLPHFAKQGTTSQAQDASDSSIKVGDCLNVRYFTSGKSGSGWVCDKGYYKYFGLTSYDKQAFEAVDTYMTGQGWKLASSEDFDLDLQEIMERNALRGFQYVNDAGLNASVTFAPRGKAAAWECSGEALCKFAQGSNDARYAGYVNIAVSYSQTPY